MPSGLIDETSQDTKSYEFRPLGLAILHLQVNESFIDLIAVPVGPACGDECSVNISGKNANHLHLTLAIISVTGTLDA